MRRPPIPPWTPACLAVAISLLPSAGPRAAPIESPATIDQTDPQFWEMTKARVAELSPDTYLSRARWLLSQVTFDDTRQALFLLQKAANIYPGDPAVLAEFARASITPYRWTWDRDEEWVERARRLLGRARRIEPDLPEVHQAAGLLAMVDGRLDEAEAEYRAALQARPDDVETLLLLGPVLRLEERYRDAYEVFDRAIVLRPADWRGHSGMADVYRDEKWYEEALNLYGKAASLHTNAFPPRFGEVKVYQRSGFRPIANKLQLDLLRQFPRWENLILLNAAAFHMSLGAYESALEELEQISFGGKRGLCQGSVLYRIGICRRNLGDADGAAVALRTALQDYPEARDGSDYGPLVLFAASGELAAAYEELGRPEEATRVLERASEHPEAPLSLQLALSAKLVGYQLHDRAVDALRRGLDSEQDDDRLHERIRVRVELARVLSAAGQDPGPVEAALEAIASKVREQGTAADLVSMARGYALVGDRDRAMDWLGDAVAGGYAHFGAIRADPDLKSLRGLPGYRSLMKGR